MYNVRQIAESYNISGTVLLDEPMSRHTSFMIGGPADLFVRPANDAELRRVYQSSLDAGLPCFLLGAGANILVADRGIRGVVIDLGALDHVRWDGDLVSAGAGVEMTDLARWTAERGFEGLENFYAMPGRVGGSIWMNARCYDRSLSDVLATVRIMRPGHRAERMAASAEAFDYKQSPFQKMEAVILEGTFRLRPGSDPRRLRSRMRALKADRKNKGHFLYPCAGSVFKNNRAFGMPSGRLIDTLGFRGRQTGGARVSDLHANIIVNTGGASARDVLALMREIEERVGDAHGFALEREILLVGDWNGNGES